MGGLKKSSHVILFCRLRVARPAYTDEIMAGLIIKSKKKLAP
jgi:hypothetical protein